MPRVKRKVCRLVGRGHLCAKEMPKRQVMRYGRTAENHANLAPASEPARNTEALLQRCLAGLSIDAHLPPSSYRVVKWWPSEAVRSQAVARPLFYKKLGPMTF